MINFLVLNLLITLVNAYPYVGFPFNEQLPDIARLGEDYKFSLNSQTFKSNDNSQITYEAFNLPTWLSFDSNSIKLFGLPNNENVSNDQLGKIDFILQGTDNQGSLNQTCSIYLSDQPSPQLNPNDLILKQLDSISETNGYNGIIFNPEESFSIKINKDTFQIPSSSNNKIVEYYGKSANRTSLPSWCFFDSNTLTFSGITPPVNSVNAPSLQFDLTLIATDYSGYAAIYTDFNIIVGGHNLYINSSSNYNNSIQANPGDDFSFDLPLKDIYLDGNVIEIDQISNVIIYDSPSWIQINDNSKISGTVPKDQLSNIVANVTLFDIYGDSVFMNFDIDVLHQIFTIDSISNITVTNGEFFEYSIPDSYFSNVTETDLDVSFDDDWLTFYHSNNTFTGIVPKNFDNSKIELNANMNSMKQSLSFYLIGKSKNSSSISSSRTTSSSISRSSSSASSTYKSSSSVGIVKTTNSVSSTISLPTNSSSNTSAIIVHNKNSNTQKNLAIGLGVAIPVAFIIMAVILYYCCCIAKRKKNNDDNDDNNDKDGNNGYIDPEKGNVKSTYMSHTNSSNATLTKMATQGINEKNLKELDKDNNSLTSSASSYFSITQSTLTDKSNNELYEIANFQNSRDQLLNSGSEILNSWRKSSNGNLQTRDSLNSLATVSTNDFLTVNMINENKQRQSQVVLSRPSNLKKLSISSDSNLNDDNNNNNLRDSKNSLTPLREEVSNDHGKMDEDIPRDQSYQTISSEAQLVGFTNRQSISKSFKREEKSCRGEIYDLIGSDFDSSSSGVSSGNNDEINDNNLFDEEYLI